MRWMILFATPGSVKLFTFICCIVAFICSVVDGGSLSEKKFLVFDIFILLFFIYLFIELTLNVCEAVVFNSYAYMVYDMIFSIVAAVIVCCVTTAFAVGAKITSGCPEVLISAIVFGFIAAIAFALTTAVRACTQDVIYLEDFK